MRAGGVEATLRMAHDLTRPPGQVIFNADRGTQYSSIQVADVAIALDVLPRWAAPACWDKAAAPSYWSTLRTEFFDRSHLANQAEVKTASGAE